MPEDIPTEEQLKEAEKQFDKLSPTEVVRIGKRIGMTMASGGIRHGVAQAGGTLKVIRKLKKLSKKARKAEAQGNYVKAKAIGTEMLKIIEEQSKKLVSPDAIEMLSAVEDDIKKSMENADKNTNGE
jgi:hypothetical protein